MKKLRKGWDGGDGELSISFSWLSPARPLVWIIIVPPLCLGSCVGLFITRCVKLNKIWDGSVKTRKLCYIKDWLSHLVAKLWWWLNIHSDTAYLQRPISDIRSVPRILKWWDREGAEWHQVGSIQLKIGHILLRLMQMCLYCLYNVYYNGEHKRMYASKVSKE